MTRNSLVLLGLSAIAVVTPSAWAQDFPARSIRMLVAFAPGGNTDILARAVGTRMADHWGKPVVVDNRPGGAGIVAAEIVAKATPDGHTVFVASTGEVAINPSLFRTLPYNVDKDFAPVTLGTVSPLLLVMHPTFPAKTLKDLIDLAKSKPRTYAYASVGVGSPMHLSGELFKMQTGTELIHVPYKGGAPATAALLGGQEAQFGFVGMGPVLPHVRAGRLRSIAISTAKRSPSVPDIPTLQELGVKDFDTSIWFAFFVPARTPKGVVSRLNEEIVRVLRSKEAQDYLVGTGVDVAPGAPQELARFVKSETEKYRKIIRVSGTRLD